MASLQFLFLQYDQDERPSMAPTIAYLLEHHYTERTIQRPENWVSPAQSPCLSQPSPQVVAQEEGRTSTNHTNARAPPSDCGDDEANKENITAKKASPPQPSPLLPSFAEIKPVVSSAQGSARPASGRRVGGAVPSSPYVPRARPQSRPSSAPMSPDHRRPACAQSHRHANANNGSDTQALAATTTAATVLGSLRGATTFVERWMEKLYFRNPVVVGPARGAASPAPADALSRAVSSGAADLRVGDQQVFRLPPRPQSSSKRAAAIREEVQRQQQQREQLHVAHEPTATSVYRELLVPPHRAPSGGNAPRVRVVRE